MNAKTTHTLARLEIGFRMDAARLKELENDLTKDLQCARQFGRAQSSPDDWTANWRRRWDSVEGILGLISSLVNEMNGSIESCDSARFEKALEAWDKIQSEEGKLAEALSAIRAQATTLNAVDQNEWGVLARSLESHLEAIQACAQALRVKLEWLKAHPKDEVDRVVRDILSKLPNRAVADENRAEIYEQELRKAAIELEQEQHQFLGFVDVAKSLFLWVETTEERAQKNLSLRLDPA